MNPGLPLPLMRFWSIDYKSYASQEAACLPCLIWLDASDCWTVSLFQIRLYGDIFQAHACSFLLYSDKDEDVSWNVFKLFLST